MAGNCSWEAHPTNWNKASASISSAQRGLLRRGLRDGCDGRGTPPRYVLLTHTLPPRTHPLARDRQGPSALCGLALLTRSLGSPVPSSLDTLKTCPVLPTSRGLVLSSLWGWGGQLFLMARPCREALQNWLQRGPEVTCSVGLWPTPPVSPRARRHGLTPPCRRHPAAETLRVHQADPPFCPCPSGPYFSETVGNSGVLF